MTGSEAHLGIQDGRVPFGHEQELITLGEGPLYLPRDGSHCPECGVARDELHEAGCPIEQCPECRHRRTDCIHS